jgi:transketolase
VLIPGVEIGTGSLGHGLGLAVGVAHGLRAQGYAQTRTFVLLGDAELDEGSNHEAIAYAAAIRLPLTAIVIDNQSATHGWPGGISARFPGWVTSVVDGRDHDQLGRALARTHHDRPNLVVATVEPKRG